MTTLGKILPHKRGNEPGLPLPEEAEHLIDFWARNIEHARFERALSGLTAVSAVLATSEVYYEHYKGSFGNKFMWSPIVVTPPIVAAGIMALTSRLAERLTHPSPELGQSPRRPVVEKVS